MSDGTDTEKLDWSDRRKIPRDRVIQVLRQERGNITSAAAILGCVRFTLYTYIKDDEDLQQILKDARQSICDNAETSLSRAVLSGEPWATCFTLKTIGKDRGYVERSEVTGADGGPIQHEIRALTDEQLQNQIAALQRELDALTRGETEESEGQPSYDPGADPDATGTDLQAGGTQA